MKNYNYFLLFINVVLVFVLPLSDTNGVVLACLGASALFGFKCKGGGKDLNYILLAWLAYSIWYLLSSLWSVDYHVVLRGIRKENLYSVVALIAGFVSFKLLNYRLRDYLLFSLILSGLMLSIIACMQKHGLGGDFVNGIVNKQYSGVGDASTFLVVFFAVSFYLFDFKNKIRFFVGLCSQVTMIFVMFEIENRMAFISIIIMYSIYFSVMALNFSRVKVILAGSLCFPLLLGIVFYGLTIKSQNKEVSLSSIEAVSVNDPRAEMWTSYFDKALDRPILGYGAGYTSLKNAIQFDIDKTQNWSIEMKTHAHNVFFNKQLQMGVVGLALFLLLYGYAFKSAVFPYRRDDLSLIAVLVFVGYFSKSLTDDFFIRNSLIMFWFLVGFFIASKRDKIESESH